MTPTQEWYAALLKPEWAPPSWLFGPVWTMLYAVILITFGYVFYQAFFKRTIPISVAIPFALNLFFNLIFSPIQFGLQNNVLASIDILLVLGTIVWMFAVTWHRAKWIALLNLPYLAWVSFATVLQLAITYLNS